jgi:hypothetical protein
MALMATCLQAAVWKPVFVNATSAARFESQDIVDANVDGVKAMVAQSYFSIEVTALDRDLQGCSCYQEKDWPKDSAITNFDNAKTKQSCRCARNESTCADRPICKCVHEVATGGVVMPEQSVCESLQVQKKLCENYANYQCKSVCTPCARGGTMEDVCHRRKAARPKVSLSRIEDNYSYDVNANLIVCKQKATVGVCPPVRTEAPQSRKLDLTIMCPLSQDFVREVLNADQGANKCGFPDPSVAVDSFPMFCFWC